MTDQDDTSPGTERYGVPLDSVLARREQLADAYGVDYGQERVFPQLIEALVAQIPKKANVLEVGAATGLLTRHLLERAGRLTALEPSPGMLRRLLESDVADAPALTIRQGMVEDLPREERYDMAVVTFTPRRGIGLSRLLTELAVRVREKVVMLLDEDGTMDWAYLARGASIQGFDVELSIVIDRSQDPADRRRAVLLVADVRSLEPSAEPEQEWGVDARDISVPYPAPRGAATRLVRFFITGGDRAARIITAPEGVDRLYGNLRTAVHRLGREVMTVRRYGDEIQIVRLPGASHEPPAVDCSGKRPEDSNE